MGHRVLEALCIFCSSIPQSDATNYVIIMLPELMKIWKLREVGSWSDIIKPVTGRTNCTKAGNACQGEIVGLCRVPDA